VDADVDVEVRPAAPDDVPEMAQVHVQSWRETYRGVMPDAVLDDPGLPAMRERFWTTVLTDPRFAENAVAVGERDGRVVGIAMSGPPRRKADSPWPRHLYVLYVLAAHHGTGLGRALLDAVVPADAVTSLWVAERNPRARRFYEKAGFRLNGDLLVDDGVRELRMVRP
jgi:ribosomal protein S18 acetylase RimI-like enzyme